MSEEPRKDPTSQALLYLKMYQELRLLAVEALKPCGTCKGSGEMKHGLVTDSRRSRVPCDSCRRGELHVFLGNDMFKLGLLESSDD